MLIDIHYPFISHFFFGLPKTTKQQKINKIFENSLLLQKYNNKCIIN